MSEKKRKRSAARFKISMKIEIFSAFLSFFSKIFVEFVKKKIKIVFVVAVVVFSVVKMKISFKK